MAVADYFNTVQKIYIAYYQRPADPAGLRYWAGIVDANGGDVSAVIDAFAGEAESQALYGDITDVTIGDFIDSFYQALFNRAPDADGKAFYTEAFTNGTYTAAQIALTILNSAQNDDAVAVGNKLQVANSFTQQVDGRAFSDPTFGQGTSFAATYEGEADAVAARALLAGVTSSPATVLNDAQVLEAIQNDIAQPGDPILNESSGQTFTLTAGIDTITGTSGNDTIVGDNTTLGASDTIDGRAGIDTLRYASSGAAAVNEAGFEASNIETVQVTSDATGGTTFDVTGVTELQTLRNFNSSEDLALVGMDRLVAVELQSVGSAGAGANDPTPDTTLTFNAAVVAGNADALSVKLNGNLNVDGSGVGDLNVAGIEIVNVTTEGAASSMNSIASGSLRAMTIAGDQNLTLAAANFFDAVNVNTVNASAFTGNLNLTLTNDNAAGIDVAVTGGTGNDTVTFQSFDTNDAFNGGDGIDTIGLTNAVAIARTTTNGGTLSNVEQLNITTLGTGVIDMDAFPGVSKVIYDAGLTNGVLSTVSDAVSGITVEVDTLAGGTGDLTVALKTDGTADVVTIELDGIAAGHSVGTLTAADAETLNISADDDTVAGNGAVTIANLALTDTTALNLSGDADLTIAAATNPATPVLATVNASAATGNLNITGLNTAAAGASITLGSGDDVFNVATSNGADTITLGLGRDTIVYNAVAQSDRDMDTITDLVSGTDIVDVRALMGGIGVASSVQFVGNRATFSQAQGALSGVTRDAVFDVNEGILWVDVDFNGTLDNNDFRVKLDGVTSLTAADLGFLQGVTFTANQAAFNTATAAHSQEGNAVGTEDDTINATVAQLVGSTVNGLGGTDVLNISGTAAAGEIADLAGITFTNVETVNLASSVEGVSFAAPDLGNGLGQTSRVAGAAGTVQSLNVATGTNLSNVTLSNIEVLNQVGTVTMTAAQHNAFQQINAAGAADQITLTTMGTLVAAGDIETYSIVEGSTLTLGTNAAGLARHVTETGAAGTVSTLILGNGAYTGTFTGIDTTDVLRVGTTTDLSGATGLNGGFVADFQDTATAGAGLSLNAAQNGVVTFANTTGNQTVTVTAVDNFTVANGIEHYSLVGGSNVTVSATNADVNLTATNAGVTTVAVGGNTVAGTWALADAADVVTTSAGADISGVNAGAVTTAENLTINGGGNVTMTAAQYTAFGANITAAGSDSITLTTSAAVNAHAAVESYVLNGAGADTFVIDEAANLLLTDAVRGGMSVDLAGGGADRVGINNLAVNNNVDSSVTITNFGADDQLLLGVNGASSSNGLFVNNYAGVGALAVTNGAVIEIDATAFQVGTPTNTAAVLAWLASANVTSTPAAGIATVVAYNGAGQAAIYQVLENSGAASTFDVIELVGIVNAADNSLVATNFA